ncbi:unnamed protein product [Caenorhabditis sp. 36 PRJEB53466]|nr:unnamed protein product [Caenorhabditis sp. 36 PRJEB53466]
MATDSITFNHILGQGRVNQLGGLFINGRPLPLHVRQAIISMANKGIKPCHISRQLKVSHGAVSKILNRYAETGSISPGQIGGSPRARMTGQAVEKEIIVAFEENPQMSPTELRDLLIQKEVCTKGNAPTVPAIRRLIGSKGLHVREKKMERKRLSYSIDSILGISIDDEEGSSPSNDSSSRRNRTSFTAEQLDVLERAFSAETYPPANARENISKETGLSEEKIMTWFSNRRARCRKNMPVIYQQYSAQNFAAAPNHYPSLLPSPMMFLPSYGTSPQLNPLFFQHLLQSSPPSSQSSPPST